MAARADGARDVIAVRRLSQRYGDGPDAIVALQDIDFSVAEGEFISIVGPSGCGKSTLLKILAGLLPASQGEAVLNGTPIDTSGPTIFQAMQKQLGLRLEAQKGPVEVLFIEHAEKPTAN